MLLSKNMNFNKNETESKWKVPLTVLDRRTLCFSSSKNRKLNVKPGWVGARNRKRGHFFQRLFWPHGIFLTFVFYLNLQCIEYTFRIYILLHIKKYYSIPFCFLFFKIVESLQIILKVSFISVPFYSFYQFLFRFL